MTANSGDGPTNNPLLKAVPANLSSTRRLDLPVSLPTGEAASLLGTPAPGLGDTPFQSPLSSPGPLSESQLLSDRYEIRRTLGSGGMGAVYAAFDRVRGEEVALKVLLPQWSTDPQARERFQREGLLAGKLSHPGIVRVFDIGRHGELTFLTMELLEQGRSLRDEIIERKRKERPFSPQEVKEFGRQLCQALAYAHSQQVVHLDVKPENIWLAEDGAVKLMDFGIARSMTPSRFATTGLAMGTAYYMAPEQLKGQADVDHRADQFSTAVVLYELLTGDVPQGAIKPPHQLRKAVPANMSQSVMNALAGRPADRYADLRIFEKELAGSVRAHTVVRGAVALLVVSGLVAMAVTYPQWQRPAGRFWRNTFAGESKPKAQALLARADEALLRWDTLAKELPVSFVPPSALEARKNREQAGAALQECLFEAATVDLEKVSPALASSESQLKSLLAAKAKIEKFQSAAKPSLTASEEWLQIQERLHQAEAAGSRQDWTAAQSSYLAAVEQASSFGERLFQALLVEAKVARRQADEALQDVKKSLAGLEPAAVEAATALKRLDGADEKFDDARREVRRTRLLAYWNGAVGSHRKSIADADADLVYGESLLNLDPEQAVRRFEKVKAGCQLMRHWLAEAGRAAQWVANAEATIDLPGKKLAANSQLELEYERPADLLASARKLVDEVDAAMRQGNPTTAIDSAQRLTDLSSKYDKLVDMRTGALRAAAASSFAKNIPETRVEYGAAVQALVGADRAMSDGVPEAALSDYERAGRLFQALTAKQSELTKERIKTACDLLEQRRFSEATNPIAEALVINPAEPLANDLKSRLDLLARSRSAANESVLKTTDRKQRLSLTADLVFIDAVSVGGEQAKRRAEQAIADAASLADAKERTKVQDRIRALWAEGLVGQESEAAYRQLLTEVQASTEKESRLENLAGIYLAIGNLPRAFEAAQSMSGDKRASYYDGVAWSAVQQKRFDLAKQYAEKGLEDARNNPGSAAQMKMLRVLADTYEKTGDKEGAIALLRESSAIPVKAGLKQEAVGYGIGGTQYSLIGEWVANSAAQKRLGDAAGVSETWRNARTTVEATAKSDDDYDRNWSIVDAKKEQLLQLLRYSSRDGDAEGTRALISAVRDLANAIRMPIRANYLTELSDVCFEINDFDNARRILGEVMDIGAQEAKYRLGWALFFNPSTSRYVNGDFVGRLARVGATDLIERIYQDRLDYEKKQVKTWEGFVQGDPTDPESREQLAEAQKYLTQYTLERFDWLAVCAARADDLTTALNYARQGNINAAQGVYYTYITKKIGDREFETASELADQHFKDNSDLNQSIVYGQLAASDFAGAIKSAERNSNPRHRKQLIGMVAKRQCEVGNVDDGLATLQKVSINDLRAEDQQGLVQALITQNRIADALPLIRGVQDSKQQAYLFSLLVRSPEAVGEHYSELGQAAIETSSAQGLVEFSRRFAVSLTAYKPSQSVVQGSGKEAKAKQESPTRTGAR